MSHWAMRRCSSPSHGVCAAPSGFFPCRFGGQSFTALSKSMWAWPPLRSSTRCSGNDFCFFMVFILELSLHRLAAPLAELTDQPTVSLVAVSLAVHDSCGLQGEKCPATAEGPRSYG